MRQRAAHEQSGRGRRREGVQASVLSGVRKQTRLHEVKVKVFATRRWGQ